MAAWLLGRWTCEFFEEAKVTTGLGKKRSRVVIAFSNPHKVIDYQNWICCILVPFVSFLFFLWKIFLMILPQHGFSIGNPSRPKTAMWRFTRIVRSNLSFLLCRSAPKYFNRIITDVPFKDGAYYCYCAYVLRISRYSDFLSPMLTNTGIFLRGLKLSGETRS